MVGACQKGLKQLESDCPRGSTFPPQTLPIIQYMIRPVRKPNFPPTNQPLGFGIGPVLWEQYHFTCPRK
jgi:hypothetical protein